MLKLLQGDSSLRLFKHCKYCSKRSVQEKTARRGREDGVLSFVLLPINRFFSLRSSLNSRHSSLFEHLHNISIKACILNRTRRCCNDGFCCIHEILLRYCFQFDKWLEISSSIGIAKKPGYLPFTTENWKFRQENQIVRAIPFWEPSENISCDMQRCSFSTLFSLFSWFWYTP